MINMLKFKKISVDTLFFIILYTRRSKYFNFLKRKKLRKRLTRFRNFVVSRLSHDRYTEMCAFGTTVKMIDGTTKLQYYYRAMKGQIHEPSVVAKLKEIFEQFDSPVFVDIGAYFGFFTIYAGNYLGPRGKVISIEANSKYYNYVLYNLSLNNLSGNNISTYNIALSDKVYKAIMTGPKENILQESRDGTVDVITFDKLCENERIKPDVVKIDVYGSEYKVLSGMKNVLRNNISHLFVETHLPELMQGYELRDVVNLLKSFDFDVRELVNHRQEVSVKLKDLDEKIFSDHEDRMLYAIKH